jgi:NAD(P)-dependent dehydrogenase (short-subunit alcohol dehydrogenase family)
MRNPVIFLLAWLTILPVAQAQESGSDQPSIKNVALVTGSTSGLGREVAFRIASTGAHVIIHGRNEQRGAEVVAEIEQHGIGSARFYRADFSSLDDVRQMVDLLKHDYDRLDLLINNAGFLGERDAGRILNEAGHELTFAVNYLAGFLLTRELLPLIRQSTPARIVNVSSRRHKAIDFDDVMLDHDYHNGRAYSQSKLAQVMFAMDLAEELEGSDVLVNSLHPGSFIDTNLVRSHGFTARTTTTEAADAVMHLVIGEEVGSGEFYDGLSLARANDQAYDAAARKELRELSEELTGMR